MGGPDRGQEAEGGERGFSPSLHWEQGNTNVLSYSSDGHTSEEGCMELSQGETNTLGILLQNSLLPLGNALGMFSKSVSRPVPRFNSMWNPSV